MRNTDHIFDDVGTFIDRIIDDGTIGYRIAPLGDIDRQIGIPRIGDRLFDFVQFMRQKGGIINHFRKTLPFFVFQIGI
ncbi:hypothetical protein SDC9_189800 [bioreactor metagenome]|uniref:Uncharacterized protein n=1 Tax=bioreactor metagenome TaxID=1076179 RepID=A0A645I1B8_9ZZZZ